MPAPAPANIRVPTFGGLKPKEIRAVHKTVRLKFKDKYKNITDAFKWVDEDRTGSITDDELRVALTGLNLFLTDNESEPEP